MTPVSAPTSRSSRSARHLGVAAPLSLAFAIAMSRRAPGSRRARRHTQVASSFDLRNSLLLPFSPAKIDITLTRCGLRHLYDVMTAVFSYIRHVLLASPSAPTATAAALSDGAFNNPSLAVLPTSPCDAGPPAPWPAPDWMPDRYGNSRAVCKILRGGTLMGRRAGEMQSRALKRGVTMTLQLSTALLCNQFGRGRHGEADASRSHA